MPLTSTAPLVNVEQQPQSWSDKLKEGYAELKAEGTVRVPTIVYSSRTHSQLAQVMKELRNTSYRCMALVFSAVIGSHCLGCFTPAQSLTSGALQAPQYCSWLKKPDVLAPHRVHSGWCCCQPSMQIPHADQILQMVSSAP